MGSLSNDDVIRLPVIDISNPTPEVGHAMIDAAAEYGFLFIESKGIDFTAEEVDRTFEIVRFAKILLRNISCD